MKQIFLPIAALMCIALAGCSSAGSLPELSPVPSASVMPTATPSATPVMTIAAASTASTATIALPSPTVSLSSAFEIKLTDLPEQYSPEDAAANGDYVNVHGKISNQEKLTAFQNAVSAKKAVAIRTVQYTTEGDPIISDVVFDGSNFTVWNDTSRDAYGPGRITQKDYKNMLEYEHENGTTYVFLTNVGEITKDLFEKGFDGYLFTYRKP